MLTSLIMEGFFPMLFKQNFKKKTLKLLDFFLIPGTFTPVDIPGIHFL